MPCAEKGAVSIDDTYHFHSHTTLPSRIANERASHAYTTIQIDDPDGGPSQVAVFRHAAPAGPVIDLDELDPETQRRYFQRQLELAREFDLPLVLHARRAVEEVLTSLRRVGGLRGVVHSWSGSEEQARQLFGLGFCLGIGGPVTYERARRLRRTVASMPLDFLLLETDAPDQPDADWRGKRNEPSYVVNTAEVLAEVKGVSYAEMADMTTENAFRCFSKMPRLS